MKIKLFSIAVLLAAFSMLSPHGFAQEIKPSEMAYRQWLEQRAKLGNAELDGGHIGVGFSVVRYKESGVLVDLSLAAGKDLSEIPSLVFNVQPLSVERPLVGEPILTEVGSSSSITSPKLLLASKNAFGIFSQPELIARVPVTATAVRIDISGLDSSDKLFSVYLPIRETPRTAVMAKAARCSTVNNVTDCQWITDRCGLDGMGC